MFGRTRCDRSKFFYADYGRTLVHASKDLQPGNAANIFHLRMKKVRMQASVSEWGVSSRAWVLFLYSTRNKNLRGFFMPDGVAFRAFFLRCPHLNLYATKVWEQLGRWTRIITLKPGNILSVLLKGTLLSLVGHFAGSNHLCWFWDNI